MSIEQSASGVSAADDRARAAALGPFTDWLEEILDEFASDLGVTVPDSDWGDAFMARTVREIAERAAVENAAERDRLRDTIGDMTDQHNVLLSGVQSLRDELLNAVQWTPTQDVEGIDIPKVAAVFKRLDALTKSPLLAARVTATPTDPSSPLVSGVTEEGTQR